MSSEHVSPVTLNTLRKSYKGHILHTWSTAINIRREDNTVDHYSAHLIIERK